MAGRVTGGAIGYQVPPGGLSLRGDWGVLRIGGVRIAARMVVFVGCVVLWLGTVLVAAGAAGVGQIWASVAFLFPLVVLGSLTRTSGFRLILFMMAAGGALTGAMYLLGLLLIEPLLGEVSRPRDVVVPTLEEVLVVGPVVVLLWAWRRSRTWSLGATDVLLVGAAVGVGFGLLEQAYLREGRPDEWLAWLPIVGSQQRLLVGHALWAGLGAATIGLGMLLRARGQRWLLVAASGSIVAALDHIANNNTNWDDGPSRFLNAVTLDGWLAVGGFLAAAVACVVADLAVIRGLERLPHRLLPPRSPGVNGWRGEWDFVRDRRALAIARNHWGRASGTVRVEVAREAAGLEKSLLARQPEARRAAAAAALGESQRLGDAAPITDRPPPPTDEPPPPTGLGIGGAIAGLMGGGLAVGLSIARSSARWSGAADLAANCDFACFVSSLFSGGGGGTVSQDLKEQDRREQFEISPGSPLDSLVDELYDMVSDVGPSLKESIEHAKADPGVARMSGKTQAETTAEKGVHDSTHPPDPAGQDVKDTLDSYDR